MRYTVLSSPTTSGSSFVSPVQDKFVAYGRQAADSMPLSEPTTHSRPAPLACLECRYAHLKCDGGIPTCGRCQTRGHVCTYTRSRRGRRRGVTRLVTETRLNNPRASPGSLDTIAQSIVTQARPCSPSTIPLQWVPLSGTSLNKGDRIDDTTRNLYDTPLNEPLDALLGRGSQTTSPPSEQILSWVDDEELVNLYYLNFHASHPILLPKNMYWAQDYPRYLKAVVQLIGGHFSPVASQETLQEYAAREIQNGDQGTVEMVQARILYTITLSAQNCLREGQQVLDSAVDSALELGMHRRDFAVTYARNLSVLEESMRRTWYELYVTEGCIAALQRKSTFKTNEVDADVLLPCEDFMYEGGMCFMPATLEEFHSSVFMEEERVFSSFCYRIEAIRLLGRALKITGIHGVHRDLVQAVDNALAAFIHHLPRSKSEAQIMNTFGGLDELMFQAHVFVQYSTILLHFPRGDLISPIPLTRDMPGGNYTKFLCSCNRQHVHSVKAIEASKTISMLAALRMPVRSHCPFFVYPLALAAAVQLSIGALHARSSSGCLEQHSDRVKLMLGVLKSLSRHWSAADIALRKLKKVALTVFRSPRTESLYDVRQEEPVNSSKETCPCVLIDSDWLGNFDLFDLSGLVRLDNAT